MVSVFDSTKKWLEQRGLTFNASETIVSTNDIAKTNALNETKDSLIYLTDHQTNGRGRGQNQWLDTGTGENLLSTWSFKVSKSPQAITGARIGLALVTAAQSTWPSLQWSLKAPNDLLLNGLKIAGLLVETISNSQQFRLIVGIGFNVLNHPRSFNEATHLANTQALTESEWFQFLDDLHQQLQIAIVDTVQTTLKDEARKQLAQALNANPNLKTEIKSISAEGDLITTNGKICWMDL